MFTSIQHTLIRALHIQFLRQLLGGVGGALIALTVYTAYRGAHDAVRAYLVSPPSDAESSLVDEVEMGDAVVVQEEEAFRRVADRARDNAALPEMMMVAQADPRQSPEVVEPLRAGAPALPNSGIGLWIAGWAALGISLASTRRVQMFLHPVQSRVD